MTGKGFSGLLDRAISVVNPQAGLRRAAARNALRFLDSGWRTWISSMKRSWWSTTRTCSPTRRRVNSWR